MGVQAGANSAFAQDFFANLAARTGLGSPNLESASQYNIERISLNWWMMLSMFEVSWVSRRIVVAPAEDLIKVWPKILGDTAPDDITKIDRAIRRTNTKNQMLEALIWARLFGGAGALIVIKGHENQLDEPLNLDDVEIGSYRGLSVFDRWSGIEPSGETCDDIDRPLDFGLSEFYSCHGKDGKSFKVHSSRILRFTGPLMPEPEKSAYQGWGISVLAPVFQALVSYDNVTSNALALSYRAQLIGLTMPDLAQLLSGLGANQAAAQGFSNRMSQINEQMSNQSLVILPKDGQLTATNYSFSGMFELKQAFQLDVSGAAKMPVSLLWGRTLNGLGQAGDGDEKIYAKTIGTEASVTMRPALEKLYPVITTSELGEVPDDMELYFPSLRDLDEKEKAELAKTTVDTVTVCINTGIMSPRTGAKEIKQASDITGFGTNLTDEAIEKLSDDVQAEGELGGGLFGEEGAKTLEPSGSPELALKETDKLAGGKTAPGSLQGAPGKPGEGKGGLKPADAPTGKSEASGEPIKRPGKALDAQYYVAERCGKPEWRTCPECDGRMHRFNCATKLDPKQDCCKERGCKYALLSAGKGTNQAIARDNDGPGPEIEVHGLPIVIENPKGSTRKGQGWETVMPYDYGYFVGIPGADGDSLDVALGKGPDNGWVYLMDQSVPGSPKKFDETKVFMNWPSCRAALDAFKAGHHRWEDVMMDWTPMPVSAFLQWLKTGNLKRPAGVQ
jgi:hypothetical protein